MSPNWKYIYMLKHQKNCFDCMTEGCKYYADDPRNLSQHKKQHYCLNLHVSIVTKNFAIMSRKNVTNQIVIWIQIKRVTPKLN